MPVCFFKSVATPVAPVRSRESAALARRNTTEIPLIREVVCRHFHYFSFWEREVTEMSSQELSKDASGGEKETEKSKDYSSIYSSISGSALSRYKWRPKKEFKISPWLRQLFPSDWTGTGARLQSKTVELPKVEETNSIHRVVTVLAMKVNQSEGNASKSIRSKKYQVPTITLSTVPMSNLYWKLNDPVPKYSCTLNISK